jgi:hypothetical protein
MIFLKQSTAVTLVIGPFVDDTDGKTAETGLTLSQADIRLFKQGGTFAQKSESTSCSHVENGYYTCPFNTTDMNTLGFGVLAVNESGALPVRHEFCVLPAATYDAWITNGLPSIFAVALTESYAADGAAGTVAQLLFLIQSVLTELSISGTVATARKLDGSTPAATFTLNSSSSPSSMTRAT